MTYVDPGARAPAYQSLAVVAPPAGDASSHKLPIEGQGTIGFAIAEKAPFTVTAWGKLPGSPGFEWSVDAHEVSLSQLSLDGPVKHLASFEKVGLDESPGCLYWFSFDCHNRRVRYGKGEMRLGTTLASYQFEPAPEHKPDPYGWLSSIEIVQVTAPIAGNIDMWRDPVTIELPMRVVPHELITMEDIARGRVTVPASLTPTCQKLYDNVAGPKFLLDTPDFPDFSAAIKASIEDKNGWCRQVLERKAEEFGKRNPDKTYLRITLGTNQGESPGIPFVMEIWPSGHYSPIHNHGGADAVIRVLHGEITVNLFAMLSPDHVEPFAVKTFVKEDVTWISARLNQVHKLINLGAEPCITIQCYLYAEENRTHWPYFDYLEEDAVRHFDPNSDADFLSFKEKMKAEWAHR